VGAVLSLEINIPERTASAVAVPGGLAERHPRSHPNSRNINGTREGEENTPSSNPTRKRAMLLRRQHRRPIIRSSRRGNGAHNLRHAQRNEHSEERDHDPAHRHDARAASEKSILEERSYTCDHRLQVLLVLVRDIMGGSGMRGKRKTYDDGEGDAKIMHQSPITSQFLLIPKMPQFLRIGVILGIAPSSARPRSSPLDHRLRRIHRRRFSFNIRHLVALSPILYKQLNE
jgi:hypothetical protein